jgi:hypothetical protein
VSRSPKRVVPSDPISSLARRGHASALSSAFRNAVRLACLLPDSRFCRLPVQRFQARRSLSSETEPFARNGLSLARNGFRFREFHSGVNGPGLLLRYLVYRLEYPFGPSTPPPDLVSPNSRNFLASGPLPSHRSTHAAAISVSTPLQEFLLLRDQRVQRTSPPPGPPSESARFPLAPRNPFYR